MRQSSRMASARKPVIVRKFSKDWQGGYAGADDLGGSAELVILDPSGKVIRIPWDEVKWVCSVRELASSDSASPERLLRKRFSVRPRHAGIWLRISLTDGDEIEGLAANDRSLIEGVGLLIIPPDTRSNTQRLYIPRQSIQSLELLGVIQPPGGKSRELAERQTKLFTSELEAE